MILIVEDNPNDRVLLSRALMQLALYSRTTFAKDGTEALTILNRVGKPPELLLVDAQLPVISSVDLVSRVRSEPRLAKITIVVITGGLSDAQRAKLEQLGAVAVLEKPVDGDWVPLLRRALAA